MHRRLISLVRALGGRGRFEAGMAEEMRFHLEAHADELVRSGLPRDEALRRARLELGGLDAIKDDCREARGLRFADGARNHLGLALRQLRKTPGFTATALGTLGLCLGANLALFAVVYAVLLRPLPFPDGERLLRVYNSYPKAGVPDDGSSITNYYERRGRLPALASLSAYREGTAVVGEPGSTEREHIAQVTPEFFATLGLGPTQGRAFIEEETYPEADDVVILTDSYWRAHLGADASAVGRRIRVDGVARRVVGVLPPEFHLLSSRARLFFPYSSHPDQREPARRHWGSSSQMLARLRPGTTLAEAQSQIDAQNAALESGAPHERAMADAGFRTLVVPLHADHVAGFRPVLLLIQAGALLLLVVGSVNLVNLLLVRAGTRSREWAVRRALGASRGTLIVGALTETLLLSAAGALVGIALAGAALRLFAVLGADRLPLGARIALDWPAVFAALLGSVVLGVLLGLPGAWLGLRGEPTAALQAESRTSTSGRPVQRLRHAFLVAQVALAFVLLASAGLLAQSLEKVMAVAPGFRPDHVFTGQLSLPWTSYPDAEARTAFADRLEDALRQRADVQAAGVITNVPMSGNTSKNAVTVPGHVRPPGEAPRGHYAYGVGGEAMPALGLSLIEGRLLEAADSRREARVCVVDEDLARHYWPAGRAIGQRLHHGGQLGPEAEAFAVVGVVRAVKQADLADDTAQGAVYYPYRHWPGGNGLFVVARTSLPAESLASVFPAVVRALDAELPVTDLRSMPARIAESLSLRRSPAVLAGLFATVAVLLATLGTYGVLSHAVAQRRREIGLRMALGARPAQVSRQFLFTALKLVGLGGLAGLVGALLLGRALQALLYQVPALHVPTLVGTGLLLGAASLAACLLPSRRAARIAPLQALNEP